MRAHPAFQLLRSLLPPIPSCETAPGAPLLSLSELYERHFLEMDDETWANFRSRRFGKPGEDGAVLTGDPVVDAWERDLAEEKADSPANADWARKVKEGLGIDV